MDQRKAKANQLRGLASEYGLVAPKELLHLRSAIPRWLASQSLGVVVEGIETFEEMHYLRRHGCETGQGYYFSEPLEASRFEQLVRLGGIAQMRLSNSSPSFGRKE